MRWANKIPYVYWITIMQTLSNYQKLSKFSRLDEKGSRNDSLKWVHTANCRRIVMPNTMTTKADNSGGGCYETKMKTAQSFPQAEPPSSAAFWLPRAFVYLETGGRHHVNNKQKQQTKAHWWRIAMPEDIQWMIGTYWMHVCWNYTSCRNAEN